MDQNILRTNKKHILIKNHIKYKYYFVKLQHLLDDL